MASIRIRFDDAALQAKIDKLDAGLSDLRPLWATTSIRLYQLMDRAFRAQGPGWEPRGEESKKRREKMGKDPNGPLLQLNGKLRGSVVAGGESAINEAGKMHMALGSNIVYANIHNYGGKIVQKRRTIVIPARPYLPTEKQFDPHLQELGEDFLEDLIGAG